MSNTALGLIETYGYTASVEAADVCLKAANVSLSACKKVRGGLVTIEIIGDVGAVKAAIDAAEAAVPRVGKLISTHVIPRPAAELDSILGDNSFKSKTGSETEQEEQKVEKSDQAEVEAENEVETDKKLEAKNKTEVKSKNKAKANDQQDSSLESKQNKKELKEHKVVELRSLAREIKNIKLTNKEIKYARKKELIEAILDAKRKGSDI
ncbi:MAG: microcompartments protein [Halanaerobium sp. 4-GBenrich]|jgi:microcompartment protein CcmL/EutN|uniref:Microcompartment protein CcmL/EutN n=1 Tax=Halanaerobium congolense TaxID=54121 RepID=A0A1M7N0P8_9FIRM|nr:BMC domain-containing protein [Halanaerobium congolense]ODS50074.1 MAG: microcompartments protein [Halanaerobium sp. 4-GBenrich]PUU95097.1 MAG: microcompartments protein [Halanaerobium sp.]PTX16107.1 microcompartment protein CcmL/EutN [Halanaerobium congolense]TDX38429.1 microcompartment protein CcmL/EutN [Halanaerobium congolense]SDF30286.1 Carboxysome shell and ethanolamine utilization microcompartment protein CcmL/EutN [Halanaerobium congolense]